MKTCKGCKHYKKDERIGIKVCEFDLFHESYCEKDKEDFAIAELEKLKTKIEEIKMKEPLMSKGFECYGFKDKTPEDIKTEIIEIIENHIEELKGE